MEFNPANIKLLVGLGNPGQNYDSTYHNVGRIAVLRLTDKDSKFRKPLLKKFFLAKNPGLLLAYLDCYMNESGRPLKSLLRYLRLQPEEILLLHDDSDLPAGEFRLSFGSSAAGHRGVESSIRELGTENFWRLRIGVRGPKHLELKAGNFVLQKINSEDSELLEAVYGKIANLFGGR